MKAKLTKRVVDDQAPAANGAPLFVFDTELAGFVLKVTPANRKIYQVRYRMGGRSAKLRTYTIGRHGAPWTCELARKEAERLLLQVRQQIDPAALKATAAAEERGAQTVEELSAAFLEIYGRAKLKPRSYEEYERAFKRHINPVLGRQKVRDVTSGDIERLHHALRHMPSGANRTVAYLSKFFSWAIRGGYRPDKANPCQGLDRYREAKRDRFLSPAEIAAVGDAIRSCEASGDLDAWQAGLIRCLMLTGMRRDELRTLKWSNVNFDRRVFSLSDSKTGAIELPIAGPVRQVLQSVPRVDDNPYVFCGSRKGQPIVNVAKPWKRVLSAAKIDPTRIHDLRHTAASTGISAGASLSLIGGVLGHRSAATTQRYAHLENDPVRATSQAIATRVARAMSGKKAKVVRFTRQR